MRARIQAELLHGPYRTDEQVAEYLGCSLAAVESATRALWMRTSKNTTWSPMDSYRLDQAVKRHRKAARLGTPPLRPMRLPADRRKRRADKAAA